MKAEPLNSQKVHDSNFTADLETPYEPVDNYVLLEDLLSALEQLKEQAYCRKCSKKALKGCFTRHPVHVIFDWLNFKQAFPGIKEQK